MNKGRFAGRNILVTGAAGGIGAAVSRRLVAEGATVVLADIDADGCARLATNLRSVNAVSPVGIDMDVSSEESVVTRVAELERRIGPIDSLVACAGVVRIHSFLEVPLPTWDRTLSINARGTYVCIREVAQRLIALNLPGKIVAIASIAARGPNPVAPDYGASKAGVVSIVQSAAVALAPHAINVNAVCPGIIDTEMIHAVHEQVGRSRGIGADSALAERVDAIPLGRIGRPEDVAGPVAFLLSKDADYITGQAINVCGGLEFD